MLNHQHNTDFAAARFNMIESQLRPNRVTNEGLLEAIDETPREQFVPPEARGYAYVDEDIEVAPGRWLLEPMVFARLIQNAGLSLSSKVLDLACATGYSTAVLARIAGHVIGVDADKALLTQAQANARALNLDNVQFINNPPAEGFSQGAPYDAILINGSVTQIPHMLFEQLAEGGRLLAVYRDGGTGTGKARIYEKKTGRIVHRDLFDANNFPLAGFEKAPAFSL